MLTHWQRKRGTVRSDVRWRAPEMETLEERRLLAFNVISSETFAQAPVELIASGSDWTFLDNGSDQGIAWRAAAFDDTSWNSGAAQLGYGDGDEATVVSFGGDSANKFTTTYFRTHFNVADPAAIDLLGLSVIRDDGVAVYLNGEEILRDGLPAVATFDQFATQNISGSAEDAPITSSISIASLPPGILVAGDNVLAVEVHQDSLTSSDISFDLALDATSDDLFMVVDFDAEVDVASLDPGDLVFDGSTPATAVTLLDADSVQFALPPLAAGAHTLAISGIDSTGEESVAIFNETLSIAADAQFAFKHNPRLQIGNAPLAGFAGSATDQIDVLWETIPSGIGTEDAFVVEYRLSGTSDAWAPAIAPTQQDTGEQERIVHSSAILGLAWDTDYEYRVTHRRADVIAAHVPDASASRRHQRIYVRCLRRFGRRRQRFSPGAVADQSA